MSRFKNIFGKAAALTAIISAATGLFWAAIDYFNKKAEQQPVNDPTESPEEISSDTAEEADNR